MDPDDLSLRILLDTFTDSRLRPVNVLLTYIEDGMLQLGPDTKAQNKHRPTEHMMLQAARLLTLAILRNGKLKAQSDATSRIINICMFAWMPRKIIQVLSLIQ